MGGFGGPGGALGKGIGGGLGLWGGFGGPKGALNKGMGGVLGKGLRGIWGALGKGLWGGNACRPYKVL